jgi:3' terminal RNA ribose 2'-O-methyltransferase Hen1
MHTAELSFGAAHLFYSETNEERCTAALMLEIDPIRLVRGQTTSGEGGLFGQYVNDRPYVASSFVSAAMAEFFGTAMGGRSKERPELADTEIPLEVHISVIAVRGGETFLQELFTPLGYEIETYRLPLQEKFPEWGDGHYFALTLRKTTRIKEFLNHLYVLIPVLDDGKHYFVGKAEIEKLLHRAGDWLPTHPLKDEITSRYLRRQKVLTREALARLAEDSGDTDPDETEIGHDIEERMVERVLSLHDIRLNQVVEELKKSGAERMLDLGCGEGRLIQLLLKEKQFQEVAGMDVSLSVLQRAERRLHFDTMSEKMKERVRLLHGSLVYRDRRLAGYDAAAIVEVIEHLDEARLAALERMVFEFAKPRTVIVTTPNSEYNVLFATLPSGTMRHKDHRFEWTRAQFSEWAARVAATHGYTVTTSGIGPEDETHGAPSQMGVFVRSTHG